MRRAGALLLAALIWAAPLTAETVNLSPVQAKAVARQALAAGDAALANALARRLAEADPTDAQALLLLAASETALGRPAEGRKQGRLAWAAARDPALRHEIARHTAFAAFAEGRPTLAQFWLRRAGEVAPTAADAEKAITDYRAVRAKNPLRFSAELAVTPTSNLNSGARGGLLMIDDFALGALTGAAQALSGTRVSVQAQVAYALPPRARSQTTWGGRVYASLNDLSSEAEALLRDPLTGRPTLTGSDLNQITAEAMLRHQFLLGPLPRPLALTLASGQSWFGGDALGPHLRAELAYPLIAGPTTSLRLTGGTERQWQPGGKVTAQSLTLEGARSLPQGDRLGWGLSLRQVQGEAANQDYTALSGEISYALAKPIGPVALSGRLTAGARDYDQFRLGPFTVTDGRQDTTFGLEIDMVFNDLSVLGYAPKVTLSGTETRSNISRFDTRQLGVSVGFASKF